MVEFKLPLSFPLLLISSLALQSGVQEAFMIF